MKCWFQINVHIPHSLRLSSKGIFLVLRTGAITSWRIQKTERTLWGHWTIPITPSPPHPPTKSQKWTNNGFRSTNSLRKHPFLLALRRWDVPSDEERGQTYVFAGYSTKKLSFLPYNWLVSFLGVLFSKATHYLPLNFTREDKTKLVDMRGNATGTVFNTINASTAEQIGHVLRLNGIDNYIELNNLKDECITNPSKCTEGLSVAFWIKYTEGK